ncbi:MAG: Gfo/Idh/MocA family oxidoreductase [Clostridiaceae bacterium]|nr:Gfo/Idh/MocA family oxidoreductase [Clostridiaceae bacterium]
MDKKLVNWGVLGCAAIADTAVIPAIKASNNGNLYALSSRNKEKLDQFVQKHKPVKAYESYDELLDDPDIHAVYIPLPNGLHYEWVLKAAQKKKHILCEKPLGISAKEVEEMARVCKENNVLLMEAFAYRHSPLTLKVKSLVDEGVVGKVNFIESHFSFILKDLNNVRLIKEVGGGCTYDLGCYNINIIRYIAGSEPISVFATGDVGEQSGVDESSCALMEFKDGLRAVSDCSFRCIDRSEYTIMGDEGIISVPVQFNTKGDVKIIVKKKDKVEEIHVDCPDNYLLEVEQFGRCILEGEEPLVSLEDSYNNAKVIDMILEQVFSR